MTARLLAGTALAVLAIGCSAPAFAMNAGYDTPTQEVSADQLEGYLHSGDPAVDAMCDSYSSLSDTVFGFVAAVGGDASSLAMMTELIDAYEIINVEGDALRLTPEARVLFIDWLHTCV